MPERIEICVALKAYRAAGKIKQEAIADIIGVTQSQISRWERGLDMPRESHLLKLQQIIYGDEEPRRRSLRFFVENASSNLILFDHNHDLIAVAPHLGGAGGPLETFGWVLDPTRNSDFADVFSSYRRILRSPTAIVVLKIEVPFIHDGTSMTIEVLKTIFPGAQGGMCLADLSVRSTVASDPDKPWMTVIE